MTDESRFVERLRRALEDASPGERTGPPVEPEQIWQAATAELPPVEVERLTDRILVDPELLQEWRIARELRAELAPGAAQPRRRRSAPILALAAALVLAAAVGVLWRASGPVGPPVSVVRGSEQQLASQVPEGAALPRGGFLLRWAPAPPGSSYTLWVADGRLDPVYEADDLQTSEHRVPARALASLDSGETVLWRVVARLPDGRDRASATYLQTIE